MGVEWTEDLATGIEAIDQPAQGDIQEDRRADSIACRSGKGKDSVASVLSFLEKLRGGAFRRGGEDTARLYIPRL